MLEMALETIGFSITDVYYRKQIWHWGKKEEKKKAPQGAKQSL